MQNWEEQRELFPTRKKVDTQPLRRRIRPNIYARLAKVCAENASAVLVICMFLFAIAVSLTAFNARFDFRSPIKISVSSSSVAGNGKLKTEFPALSSLIALRISAKSAAPAKAAAEFLSKTLQADDANIAHVIVPGIGPFYDRFGILYLDESEVAARVQHTMQLKPLFQALAVSPNLAGLSVLVSQVATAVKNGRSPQGLEDLFLQISKTVQMQAAGKPSPLDWRVVAGLTIESTNKDWVVIVQPNPKKLIQSRQLIENLIQSMMPAYETLKITSDFPPESTPSTEGSNARQVVVFFALATLFVNLLLVFSLQNMRMIMLVSTPVLASVLTGFAVASLVALKIDRVVVTFIFAALVPSTAISCCSALALARTNTKARSNMSFIMLAAQDIGPLVMAMTGVVVAVWGSWSLTQVASISILAVVVTSATVSGMAATIFMVPSLAVLLPHVVDERRVSLINEDSLSAWRKIRPLLAVLLMAVSAFCIVFFSSLHFGNTASSEATRGLQFLAANEKSAENLSRDLKTVPEVGAVRWMGNFMPQDIATKQNLLQSLSGMLALSNDSATIGPQDLLTNLQDIEMGLRTIADEAGTDETLRASAHEFRRSLAVMSNTATNIEPVAAELEQLIFSKFGELPKAMDDFARLSAPELSDFDPNLRKLFVSDGGAWRVEVLPKRVIAPAAFIGATQHVASSPLGPLVEEQGELNTLKSLFAMPLLIGLLVALVIALVYLQQVADWLIVVFAALMPFALYAAFAVITETAIEPLNIPAVIMVSTASIIMALLSVVKRPKLPTIMLSVFLPMVLVMAIILPMQLLQIRELAEFSRSLSTLLACAVLFNIVVIQQLSAWSATRNISSPRLKPPTVATQPKENLSDNIF